jgi:hypothetical protein
MGALNRRQHGTHPSGYVLCGMTAVRYGDLKGPLWERTEDWMAVDIRGTHQITRQVPYL